MTDNYVQVHFSIPKDEYDFLKDLSQHKGDFTFILRGIVKRFVQQTKAKGKEAVHDVETSAQLRSEG